MTLAEQHLATVRELWARETVKGIARAEAQYIAKALTDAGMGGMKVAAESLGMPVPTLLELMKQHNLTPIWRKAE